MLRFSSVAICALGKIKNPLQRICIARDEFIPWYHPCFRSKQKPDTRYLLNAQARSALLKFQANGSGGKVRLYLNRKALAADDAFSLPEGKILKTPSTPFSYVPYSSGILRECQAKTKFFINSSNGHGLPK